VAACDAGALRVHDFMARSRANGPGVRAVLWLQGCSLRCPGCFNPGTHPPDAGDCVQGEGLLARIADLVPGIEGLTVSGGEPLEQARPLRQLLERVRLEAQLSVILLTGFTWQEVTASPEMAGLLPFVDVLVAGRYERAHRVARGLRGSDNKTMHFLTDRYGEDDLDAAPTAEIAIGTDGEVVVTGIDPPDFDPETRV
jgi:anaerobic ribonucleoside-triphosphate reductase activating protein